MKYSLIDSIAYRGDTRHPREIFRKGFWNKQTPEFLWQQIAIGKEDPYYHKVEVDLTKGTLKMKQLEQFGENPEKLFAVEPLQRDKTAYKFYLKTDPTKYLIIRINKPGGILRQKLYEHYASNLPQYRDEEYWRRKEPGKYGGLLEKVLKAQLKKDERALDDINPESAVCLTLRLDCAPYFPVEGSAVHGKWVWIYAAYISAAVKSYRIQQLRGASLSFAKEIAVEHVPASYILCAVHCKRQGRYPNMQFNFVPRILWNPNVHPEIRARWSRYVQREFSPYQGYLTICPTPTSGTIPVMRKLIWDP